MKEGELTALGTSLQWALLVVICTSGLVVAAQGVYLLILAGAALAYRAPGHPESGSSFLTVLVPAHDEETLIRRCLGSLAEQTYSPDNFEVVVIADNCTDQTARLAEDAGVKVMMRDDTTSRGKGRALRWAMDAVMLEGRGTDAFVVVDADSVADPGLLKGLAAHLEAGAEAVQAQYLALDDQRHGTVPLQSVAFLLFHRVRLAGKAVLGLPCNLVGNGMLFSRSLISRQPWSSFTSAEDLEFTITLRLAGVRPVFAGGALVRAPLAISETGAQVQRERWEGGRLHVAITALPRLVREVVTRRRFSLIDAVIDLAIPPLSLLAVAATVGTVVSVTAWVINVIPLWAAIPWVVALGATAGFVLVGLFASGASGSMYRSLWSTPRFVARKVLGTAGVLRNRAADTWVRTERPSRVG